jgi:hypothetical protein
MVIKVSCFSFIHDNAGFEFWVLSVFSVRKIIGSKKSCESLRMVHSDGGLRRVFP